MVAKDIEEPPKDEIKDEERFLYADIGQDNTTESEFEGFPPQDLLRVAISYPN